MKLAFLISAHTDPQQLKRLIEALPDESHFFVHIDVKSDICQFTNAIQDSRVHFLEHRVNVVWGSIVEVEYQMLLVQAALGSGNQFDYLVTLSGLDYPVWSKQRIKEFFDHSEGREYLCGNDLSAQDEAARLYRQYRFFTDKPWKNGSIKSKFRVALRMLTSAVGICKPLSFEVAGKYYHLYKGAAWWAITPELAAFVLGEWQHNKPLVKYFCTSFCPAETFAQTVAFNSEWKGKCLLQEGRWQSLKSLTPLTYIYYHPVIKVMEEEDVEKVLQSGKMFARKVVSGKSDTFVAKIEEEKR